MIKMVQLVAEYAISDEPLGNQAIYIDGVSIGLTFIWSIYCLKL